MTEQSTVRTVLGTGATGRVGRHVVDGLVERGVGVRAMSRTITSADMPAGVTAVQGDLEDPQSVAAAAQSADAAFLLWMSGTADAAAATVSALVAEVGHIAYLSAANLQTSSSRPMSGAWADVEQALRASSADWSFVRSGGFAANTLGWAAQVRAGNTVALPYPEAVRSLVHERDLAIECLLEPRHRGQAYAVTGPEALSQAEQVAQIGQALQRDLVVHAQDPDEARQRLAQETDPDFADQSLAYWAGLVDRPERVSADVERVTGRPARSFTSWVEEHRAAFTG